MKAGATGIICRMILWPQHFMPIFVCDTDGFSTAGQCQYEQLICHVMTEIIMNEIISKGKIIIVDDSKSNTRRLAHTMLHSIEPITSHTSLTIGSNLNYFKAIIEG